MAENDGEMVTFSGKVAGGVSGSEQIPVAKAADESEPAAEPAAEPEPKRRPLTRIDFGPGSDGGAPTFYNGITPIAVAAGINLGGPGGGEPCVMFGFDLDQFSWRVELEPYTYGAGALGCALIAAVRMADPELLDVMSGPLDALEAGRIADVATISPAAGDAQRLLFRVGPKISTPMVFSPTTWVASQTGVQSIQVRVELAQGENAGSVANPHLIEIALCAGNRWLTAGLTSPSAIVLGMQLIAAAGAACGDALARYGRDAVGVIRRSRAPISVGQGGRPVEMFRVPGCLHCTIMQDQTDVLWRRLRIPERPVMRMHIDAVGYGSAEAMAAGMVEPTVGWPFQGNVTAEQLGPGEYAASQQRQGEWVARWNASRAKRAA